MNILFICSANKHRSKTAEDYFQKKYPDNVFLSAGTNKKICQQEGTELVTDELLEWADVILVMENKHREIIQKFSDGENIHKIKVLDIPDVYKYYDKDLIKSLEDKSEKYFN